MAQNKKRARTGVHTPPVVEKQKHKQNAPEERLFTAPDLRLCFRRVRHVCLEPVHVGRTQIFATHPAHRTVPRRLPFPFAATISTAVRKQEPVASLLPPAEMTQFDPALHNRGGIATQHDNIHRKMRRQFTLWRCEQGRCSSGATWGHGKQQVGIRQGNNTAWAHPPWGFLGRCCDISLLTQYSRSETSTCPPACVCLFTSSPPSRET